MNLFYNLLESSSAWPDFKALVGETGDDQTDCHTGTLQAKHTSAFPTLHIQRLHCQDKNAISAKKEKKPSIRRMWLGQLFEQPQMLWTVLPEQPKLLFEQCCMLKTSLAIQSQTTSLHVFYSLCNKVVTSRILSLSSSYVHNIGFQFIPGKSFISYRFRINHWAKYLLIWFH